MKAQEGVTEVLNGILSAEPGAIRHYRVHATVCNRRGSVRLQRKVRERSLRAVRRAGTLIGHLLHLESVPKVHRATASCSERRCRSN